MIASGSSLRGLSEVMMRVIGILIDDLGHQRALLPVAIAAATENDNQATRLKFAQSLKNIEQARRACARNRRKPEIAASPELLRIVPAPAETCRD